MNKGKEGIKLGADIIDTYKPYRNQEGKYKRTVISRQAFEIDQRYDIIDVIGQGAYGIVVASKDKQSKDKESELVAIKKIDKAFEHKIFAKRTLRELRLLRLLNHENIIGIKTIILPKSREEFEDVYVISELMDTDLTQILKSQQELGEDHYKFFLYQILRGLKYMHSANIVHRDLKPRNLLVNSNCDLKIADFGLARPLLSKIKSGVLTEYVATRWYRPPELLLGMTDYTTAVDMWSVGIIFAEILGRKPFLPGTDTKNQLELIGEFIGFDDIELMKDSIPAQSLRMVRGMMRGKKAGRTLSSFFPKASESALDLLSKLLKFDPKQRITVEQALRHPYLADLHMQDDQPSCQPLDYLDFQFQNHNLTNQQLKDMLYEEILLYHSKQFYKEYETKKKQRKSLIGHILKNSNKNNIDPDADNDED